MDSDGYDAWNFTNGTDRPFFVGPPIVDTFDAEFVKANLRLENGRTNRSMHRNGSVEVMSVVDVRESSGLLSVFERGTKATIVLRFDILEIHFFDDNQNTATLQGFQGEQHFNHNDNLFCRWWFNADSFITVDGVTVEDKLSNELMEYQMERRSILRQEFFHVFPSLFDAFINREINVRNPGDQDNDSEADSDID